jgi:hypothetical protein
MSRTGAERKEKLKGCEGAEKVVISGAAWEQGARAPPTHLETAQREVYVHLANHAYSTAHKIPRVVPVGGVCSPPLKLLNCSGSAAWGGALHMQNWASLAWGAWS